MDRSAAGIVVRLTPGSRGMLSRIGATGIVPVRPLLATTSSVVAVVVSRRSYSVEPLEDSVDGLLLPVDVLSLLLIFSQQRLALLQRLIGFACRTCA